MVFNPPIGIRLFAKRARQNVLHAVGPRPGVVV